MYLILAFDTEDVDYAPAYRIDDIPGWLAEIMTETGIRGSFFVLGEKARLLRERGRSDVLDKMARHDIASHTQGNFFPLMPQVCENKGWKDGMAAIGEYEDVVRDEIKAAFGREPVALSRHGSYWTPQHVAIAGARGLPYMYLPIRIPDSNQPVWYAGAVGLGQYPETFFGSFDRIYSRDELFEQELRKLEGILRERLEAGVECVTLLGCHPLMVMAREWIEFYRMATGKLRSLEEVGWHYRIKPRHEEERAKANFRRLCVMLKEHPDVEVIGVEEAGRLFSTQPTHIGRDNLVAYAKQFVQEEKVVLHETFSPAELVCGLARSLVEYSEAGDLPEEVERRNVYGPETRPVVGPETTFVDHNDMVDLSRQLLRKVESDGCLPANVAVARGRIGLGQYGYLAAKSYLALARYDKYERLAIPVMRPYPELAFEIDASVRRLEAYPSMPLDYCADRIADQARLQSWTIKPAWLRPPQGPVACGPYAARCAIRTGPGDMRQSGNSGASCGDRDVSCDDTGG